jgi:hypothetical protein
MLNQKESVFQAVLSVAGEFEGAVQLSKEQRSEVVDLVTASILSGDTEFSADAKAKHDTEQKVRTYCVGLVNNWLRKDTRLNGGEKYQAKNPGSRVGSSDPVVRELRKLLSHVDEEQQAVIQAEIDSRLAAVKEQKMSQAKKVINSDLIPDHLKHLVG